MSVELTQRIIHVKNNGTYDSLDIFRGAPGEKGDKGDTGQGLIPGGSTGQVLKKRSGTDYDTEWANDASAVTDVQVNGTSILSGGVANIPVGSGSSVGVVSPRNGFNVNANTGNFVILKATSAQIKNGTENYQPVVPANQNESVFYGLAKAAGDSTQSASDNAVGTYTEGAKTAIRTMIGAGDVDDVQVDGTSVVTNGVANVPLATDNTVGVVKGNPACGIRIASSGGALVVNTSDGVIIKAGTSEFRPISPKYQDYATFYGLAKAAGADMASSSNAVGTYTDAAKDAIRAMIGVDDGMKIVDVSGATPTITGENNTMYRCGTVTSISITPPQTGVIDVIFTSGSTVAVMTIPNTVEFPEWFDPTDLETNRRYEINIADGWAVVMSWPV